MAGESRITKLTKSASRGALTIWAADCAERVLIYFESKYPKDDRPMKAIEAGRGWACGRIRVSEARTAAFAAHAAAREAKDDGQTAACFAARAAGQAAGTAHVAGHAVHAAGYAVKAIEASDPANAEINIAKERDWQYRHLRTKIK